MAYGNNLYANISGYVNTIYDGALLTLRESVLAPSLVRVFNDRVGMAVRDNSGYGTATINQVGEADDLTSQTFTPSSLATLTPYEYGAQFLLTDQRLESDPFPVQSDAAAELGGAIAEKMDRQVFSNFSSLTGGTVGASGSAISWTYFFNAVALLAATHVPRPYVAVMHPYQWVILARAAGAGSGSATNVSEMLKSEVDQNFYAATVGGVRIYTNSYVQTSGNDAYVGFWSLPRPALALDIRRAPRLERERDASKRAWELNMTGVFAHGVWEPAKGVQGIFALTTPS
jgi:hypothetical protein